MPELPEVETVRRGLAKLIVGREILAVKILNAKSLEIDSQYFAKDFKAASFADLIGESSYEDSDKKVAKNSTKFNKNFRKKSNEKVAKNVLEFDEIVREKVIAKYVIGAKIIATRRRAKVLIIDLSTDFSLVIHLKMTGQIVVREGDENWGAGHPTGSFVAQLPDKTTRVIFDLSRDATLFFNDQRKFGWVKLVPTAQVSALDFIAKLGPEIADFSGDFSQNFGREFDEKLAQNEFIKRARKHANSPIKAVILDQSVMSGIGNIYADESLWGAKIHPAARVKNLSDLQLKNIFREAKTAMEKSLAAGGSTMQNYIQADGTRGNYIDKFANVFRREGQPCPRCGAEIVKTKVAGRGTHICRKCQKESV